jgi:hypothetical protein
MWCRGVGRTANEIGTRIEQATNHAVVVPLSEFKWARLVWFSGFIAASMEPFDSCLLWITQSGVWPSSENWHLFYRLRETYGERRLLAAAPGQLFLPHELADLATFIGMALLFGWDFYVVPNRPGITAFVSHDGFLDLYADDENAAEAIRQSLSDAHVSCEVRGSV